MTSSVTSRETSPTESHLRRSERIDGLVVEYDDRVLRPRPWTALQSAWAAELLAEAPEGRVLELCSGAGHIGLLTVRATDRHLVAVDLDPVACRFMRHNAEGAGLAHRVEVREARLDEALRPDERFVLVIADPPWVPSAGIGRFPEDPVTAIDGGTDGLAVAAECVRVAGGALVPGGQLLLQLGNDDQADAVSADAAAAGGWRELGRRHAADGVVLRLDRA